MLKRVVVLLLFVQFSFGQTKDTISFNILKGKRFSIGINYTFIDEKSENWYLTNHTPYDKKGITREREREKIVYETFSGQGFPSININYKLSTKSLIGIEFGNSRYPAEYGYDKSINRNHYGLIYGYSFNNKLTAKINLGLWKLGQYQKAFQILQVENWEEYVQTKGDFLANSYEPIDDTYYGGISLQYNFGFLNPEIGIKFFRLKTSFDSIKSEYDEATGQRFEQGVGSGSFWSNFVFLRAGINYQLNFNPTKNKAIKKLTQAKNALDLELITQEEYDKVYVKYAHFAKDKP